MSKAIYLFKEHKNFQVGKSKLSKNAVFSTHIFWISLALVLGLFLLTVGGSSVRLAWQYSQDGAETDGELLSCRYDAGYKGGGITYVRYQYTVDGQVYEAEDRVERWEQCTAFPTGTIETVYYLSDNPQESGLEDFVTLGDWMLSLFLGSFGIVSLIACFYMMMKNRREQRKYALLQKHADILIEATIIYVGEIKGKYGYLYADYIFASPNTKVITGQIRSGKAYEWPDKLQKGDTLSILYLDDETYCVL